MRSIEFSLERLGVDRVDILYAHDLDVFNHQTQEVLDTRIDELMTGGYRALLALREQGAIKAFVAGLNEWQPCQTLAERGDFDLFLLAGRYTLLEQDALSRLRFPNVFPGVLFGALSKAKTKAEPNSIQIAQIAVKTMLSWLCLRASSVSGALMIRLTAGCS